MVIEWLVCLAIIIVAIAGKLGASMLIASGRNELAHVLSPLVLMNTRIDNWLFEYRL